MFIDNFFKDDEERKLDWFEKATECGLCSDSISKLINSEIDTYNSYNQHYQMPYVSVVPISQDELIDDNVFINIKSLEKVGTYDLIDIFFGLWIGWILGFIFGYIFATISPNTSEEFIGKTAYYLFSILWFVLFVWLTYEYITISMELENTISSNFINSLILL